MTLTSVLLQMDPHTRSARLHHIKREILLQIMSSGDRRKELGEAFPKGRADQEELPDQADEDNSLDGHKDPIWDHNEAIRSLHSDPPVGKNRQEPTASKQ
ncbi:hypothetical protein PGT21_024789 [Puccinia graminis f. sp. tritici]|uniref:Uncharacterized protein n=1 Tax=Puccinia graminis f. sp. tritici TaxID=56615 RepID=A0A5B0MLQ2_PUCGR|nr:hypothetical protein PGT21_024789 [Puccinia graminis f. sp. tritici]KAA1078920.1 hypothetical protein PGTUg99_021195 [Puccinia graminis f. sp. tritici]